MDELGAGHSSVDFPFGDSFPLLTWGGMRGGICIAMALSLPNTPIRDIVLMATYLVVMFSVLVQGLTVNRMIKPAPPLQEGANFAPWSGLRKSA
jgi:CPA1 family monovalent cation:H+ antiporter